MSNKRIIQIMKQAVREHGGSDWHVGEDGVIYWDYVSEKKPAFGVEVGECESSVDGSATRVSTIDLTLNEYGAIVWFGTDKLLCCCYTIEEAIYRAVVNTIIRAKYTY